jgi:SnoaL-like polyketide cyclase
MWPSFSPPFPIFTAPSMTSSLKEIGLWRATPRAVTHRGEFMGIRATGRNVTFRWVTIYRIADGKVAEEWPLFDGLELMRQLGAVS